MTRTHLTVRAPAAKPDSRRSTSRMRRRRSSPQLSKGEPDQFVCCWTLGNRKLQRIPLATNGRYDRPMHESPEVARRSWPTLATQYQRTRPIDLSISDIGVERLRLPGRPKRPAPAHASTFVLAIGSSGHMRLTTSSQATDREVSRTLGRRGTGLCFAQARVAPKRSRCLSCLGTEGGIKTSAT